MWRALLPLILCSACLPQERNPVRDAVEWSVSLRGYIAQMSNPVVRVYGTASLAQTVCRADPEAASGLYRDAISSLFNLPDDAFKQKGTTPLPVASFSGLFKYVIPAAVKCDPGLVAVAENQRARERMALERAAANATLKRAYGLIDPQLTLDKADNLDRAAQMAGAAIEAGDPLTLDFSLLSLLLSTLNPNAPDLADDLFARSVAFVMSEEAPSPDSLQTLARFLLTDPPHLDSKEEDQEGKSYTIGNATVENLTAARKNANPDNIEILIEAIIKLLGVPTAIDRNPVVAYALAYQLLPVARDLLPDRALDLEKALVQMEAESPSAAAGVRSRIATPSAPDPESGDPAARDAWLVSRIRTALGAGQIDLAAELLTRIADRPARAQVKEWIAFEEASIAIEKRSDQAVSLVNLLRPGVKRSLLYIAAIAAEPRLDLALAIQPLAARDIAQLPAEQRVRLLAALAKALLRSDVDSSIAVVKQIVDALNDIRVNPRRLKFDPASARRIFNSTSGGGSDSALLMPSARGFYEAIQLPRGRQNFGLRASGAETFTLNAYLTAATTVSFDRLTAIVPSVRDENTQAAAWVTLAGVRLKKGADAAAASAKP